MNTSAFRSIPYLPSSILAMLASASIGFAQGLLTPPGPPGPTMKTLDQIEARTPISSLPFIITEPGSYYLTSNLTGVSGQSGITINASDVTVDLNGFTLTGVAGSLSGVNVTSSTPQRNIAIRNGTIRNWGQNGVLAQSASNSQFENLRVSNNGSNGILAGSGAAVKNCAALENDEIGIYTVNSSTITGCTATLNNVGIDTNSDGTVIGCSASKNDADGFRFSGSSNVTDCTAVGNGGVGIFGQNRQGAISRCISDGNGGDGFANSGISGDTVIDCTASGNAGGPGINARTVTGCNSHDNVGTGIFGEHVTNSRASSNKGDGISGGTGGTSARTVIGCTVSGNTRHGIKVSGMAKDNQCNGNGADGNGAGIYFDQDNVRIEGNNCNDNDWGIQSDAGTNSYIVRNSCRGNTMTATNTGASANYDFDRATNTYGPLIFIGGGDMSAHPNAGNSHPGLNLAY